MGHSAPSPSDNNIIHPRSLTERLEKVEADGEPQGEPSFGHATSEVSGSRRNPWVSSALVAVLIVVSLVPTATIGAMFWQGVIRTPWSSEVVVEKDSQRLEAQQAIPSPTAETLQQEKEVEDFSVALTMPSIIEAEGGKEVPFSVTLNSPDPFPLRSIITIQGLPEGTTLSHGRPYGETEWTLRPDEIGDLRLRLPKAASGDANLRIALVAADGTTIASAATQLNFAADPKTALILRPDERERIADLIAHGQKMVDVGYLAGARGYFKRAAEAGSADAALALGATYDPKFLDDTGVKGMKADLAEARAWYEHAQELGAQGVEERLAELDTAKATYGDPVQSALSGPAQSAIIDVDAEWIEVTAVVNLREGPSSSAPAINVIAKGTKLRATGRKDGWVQVTNPATLETGWVYSGNVATTSKLGSASKR